MKSTCLHLDAELLASRLREVSVIQASGVVFCDGLS